MMILKFVDFINEDESISEEKEEKTPFQRAGKGGLVIYRGTKYMVQRKFEGSMILVPWDAHNKTINKNDEKSVNSNMFNMYGKVVKKSSIK